MTDDPFFAPPEVDYPEVSKDYPLATVVYSRPRVRLNYSTWFAIITLAIYVASLIIFH